MTTDAQAAAAYRADMVRALTEERQGYMNRGQIDRAAAVDAELKRFGAAPIKRTAPRKSRS